MVTYRSKKPTNPKTQTQPAQAASASHTPTKEKPTRASRAERLSAPASLSRSEKSARPKTAAKEQPEITAVKERALDTKSSRIPKSAANTKPARTKNPARATKSTRTTQATTSSKSASAKNPRDMKAIIRRALIALCALIICALIGASAYMAWNHWWRFNDEHDIVGTWVMRGSDKQVIINDAVIDIADEIHYRYTMNTQNKTLTITLEDKTGTSEYRFSPDRGTLIIDESHTADFWVQMGISPDAALEASASSDDVMILDKVSNKVSQ